MRARTALTLVATVFVLARTDVVRAQTADEVMDKHLAAIGGREALTKITSRTMNGSIALSTPAGEVTGTIQVFNKAPNKARSVIKVDLSQFGVGELVVDQRFDGNVGYVLDSMNGNRDITGAQLDNMKNAGFPTALLNFKERFSKAELMPDEKVGDRDTYVLQDRKSVV